MWTSQGEMQDRYWSRAPHSHHSPSPSHPQSQPPPAPWLLMLLHFSPRNPKQPENSKLIFWLYLIRITCFARRFGHKERAYLMDRMKGILTQTRSDLGFYVLLSKTTWVHRCMTSCHQKPGSRLTATQINLFSLHTWFPHLFHAESSPQLVHFVFLSRTDSILVHPARSGKVPGYSWRRTTWPFSPPSHNPGWGGGSIGEPLKYLSWISTILCWPNLCPYS